MTTGVLGSAFRRAVIVCALSSTQVLADATDGAWSPIMDWDFIPIHAVNLPDGRVLTYGGTPGGGQGGHISYTIYDPAKGFGTDAQINLPNTTQSDSFCSAMLLMAQSGRVLAVSGDSRGPQNRIERNRNVLAFEANGEQITQLNRPISRQRWYGTPVLTGTGEFLMLGGTCWGSTEEACTYYDGNRGTVPEIYRPSEGWSYLSNVSVADGNFAYGQSNGMVQWWYPRAFLMSNGNVFSLAGGRAMSVLDPSGEGQLTNFPLLDDQNFGATNSAVMYRPDKVLVTGGGGYDSNGQEPDGRRFANIFDVSSGTPVRSAAAPMTWGRQWHNMTMLPDGRVLVTGGSTTNNVLEGVRNEAEVWDPDTNTWEIWAEGPTARLYHSVAILMQDGRIFTGGGGAPGPLTQKNADVFSPPYLFKPGMANRLEITDAPVTTTWSETATLSVNDANRVSRVTLIGYGGSTHSINFGQRFLELDFTRGANNTINVALPDNRNEAPPQYYMMFVLDRDDVPSVAHTIKILDDQVVISPDLEDLGPSDPGAEPPRVISLPNDSFENNTIAEGGWGITALEGWNGSIEVWRNHRGYTAADGDSWIELDANTGTNTAERLYNLDPGETATLRFFTSPRPGVSAASNEMSVSWNGTTLDTISADGIGLTSTVWTEHSYTITGAEGRDVLTFFETDADGVGMLMDNVTLETTAADIDYIADGSFETNTISNGGWGFQNYVGWGTRIETWRNHRGYSAFDGESWVELDGDRGPLDTLSQTMDVPTGATVRIRFAAAPRPGVPAASNAFEVLWNDQVLATISEDGTAATSLEWQEYSYTVTGTDGDDTLSFRETSTDGLGSLIDAVSVTGGASNDPGPQPVVDPGNGGLEDNTVANGGWGIRTLAGWDTPIEVWRNHRGYSAFEGDSWMEIDRDRGGAIETSSRTYDVPTGQSATISFAAAPRPGVSAASNTFEVLWNGTVLATIGESGAGDTALDWQTYSYTVTGQSGDDILGFREQTTDGLGSLLDAVSVQ